LTAIESGAIDSTIMDTLRVFRALADSTRLRLLAAMVDRPRCGQDLAAEVGVSAPTVSHHLKVLSQAELLTETRQSPYVFYQLDLGALQRAVMAVSTPQRVRELAPAPSVDQETRDVLRNFFDGPRLRSIPAQRRKKEIVFEELLRRLPRRREYAEPELNRFIEVHHPDFCTIRRELIMGRYMKREAGVYRLAERGQAVVDA
jgi:hypothetical protein